MTAMRYPLLIERLPLEARFELAGDRATMSAVLQGAGISPPDAPPQSSDASGICTFLLGPRRVLLRGPIAELDRLGRSLRSAILPGAAIAVADVTGATVTFKLGGSGLADVLAQGCSHDVASPPAADLPMLATEAWGIAILLERRTDSALVTVDTSLASYLEHMLRAAAGMPVATKAGVMQAPPPPIRVES